MMKREELDEILSTSPLFEEYRHCGSEPELSELIYRYYRSEFSHERSSELSERYVTELLNAINVAEEPSYRDTHVCVNAHDRCEGSFPCPLCELKDPPEGTDFPKEKSSTLTMNLVADSGYSSATIALRISPDQWHRIMLIVNESPDV